MDPLETLFTFEENLHACMTMELKELEDRIAEHPALDPVWQTLKAFLRRPGKRVRPSLFLLSYSLFDGRETPPPAAAFRVACALEIFHAFALIHDDLIDCSDSRRGKPTLHRALQGTVTRSEENARSLALVLGDILFGFAMEAFIDPNLPPAHSQVAMRYFLRIAQETGMGQA
ncbi:MAG: polyprenyl synthetase family protein, partial [Puniceicoccales bacterium]